MRPPTRIPRFYCSQLPHPRLSDSFCTLDSDETRHARKVLRLKAGNPVELFDGCGGLASATIERFDGPCACCRVTAVQTTYAHKPIITLATAIPKSPHADPMIRQLSQVGGDRVIPLHSEYGVVQPGTGKLQRFARQSIESAKQSQRLFFMTIEPARSFVEVLDEPHDVGLIAVPPEPGEKLPGAEGGNVDQLVSRAERVLLLVGPEGGWSPQELELAKKAKLTPWAIGPHVMRIETAGPVAVALLRYLGGRSGTP